MSTWRSYPNSPEGNARRYRDQLRELVSHLEAAKKLADALPNGWNSEIPRLRAATDLLVAIGQGMVHDINTYFTNNKLDAAEEEFIDATPYLPAGGEDGR